MGTSMFWGGRNKLFEETFGNEVHVAVRVSDHRATGGVVRIRERTVLLRPLSGLRPRPWKIT